MGPSREPTPGRRRVSGNHSPKSPTVPVPARMPRTACRRLVVQPGPSAGSRLRDRTIGAPLARRAGVETPERHGTVRSRRPQRAGGGEGDAGGCCVAPADVGVPADLAPVDARRRPRGRRGRRPDYRVALRCPGERHRRHRLRRGRGALPRARLRPGPRSPRPGPRRHRERRPLPAGRRELGDRSHTVRGRLQPLRRPLGALRHDRGELRRLRQAFGRPAALRARASGPRGPDDRGGGGRPGPPREPRAGPSALLADCPDAPRPAPRPRGPVGGSRVRVGRAADGRARRDDHGLPGGLDPAGHGLHPQRPLATPSWSARPPPSSARPRAYCSWPSGGCRTRVGTPQCAPASRPAWARTGDDAC